MSEPRIKPSQKSPSAATDKAMAMAAKDRRRIAVNFDGVFVNGYQVGADRYHWVLLAANGNTHLIHKTAPWVTIEKLTIDSDPDAQAADIASSIEPYRASVMAEHFSQPARNEG